MSDEFDHDFAQLVRDIDGDPRHYARELIALRAEVERLKLERQRVEKLPDLWRKLNSDIPLDLMSSIHEAANELEAALKQEVET